MDSVESSREWAREVFGAAALGDARWTQRLVRLAEASAERPGGKVTHVCRTSGERQGAYDLLNSPRFGAGAIHSAVVRSTALRCAAEEIAFVAIDGTSLSLTDRAGQKDFGSIGARHMGVRGLKFLNAYALGLDGTPLGLLQQICWRRPVDPDVEMEDASKESAHWVDAVERASLVLSGAGARGWFQLDREGDSSLLLQALSGSGHLFTVRSSHSSRRVVGGSDRKRLRHYANGGKLRYTTELRVQGNAGRRRRLAKLEVLTNTVVLDLVEPASGKRAALPVNVVDVREVGTTPRGEAPVHWRLLTNHPVTTLRDVQLVVFGYQQRWRVEELHKTWKSGACSVEETQLRSMEAVLKWATIMAATATRIERLKHLHRNEPERAAADELTSWEIKAAVILRKKYKKRTDPMPTDKPTLGEIVSWIADLGGYTGKSSGGPPGSIVIRRGLEMIAPLAAGLEQLASEGKLR
jgi:hypothetical protein